MTPTTRPDLIVKQLYSIDATGEEEYAVPEVLLLGNSAGLRQLGNWLIQMADRVPNPENGDWDPDDHQHLRSNRPPFNAKLSDDIEFRVGILTPELREAALAKYNITEATRQRGDLAFRYRAQADAAEKAAQNVRRHLR